MVHKQGDGTVSAKRKYFELPGVGILRIAYGKVPKMWVEWDNVYMLAQLGHMGSMTEVAQ